MEPLARPRAQRTEASAPRLFVNAPDSGDLSANSITAECFLEQVDDQRLNDTYRYWDGLRGKRFAPSYAQIDPVNIPKLLRYLLVTEIERTARGRQSGRAACRESVCQAV